MDQYSKFRSPFFSITVSDHTGTRKKILPDFLLGLVEKVTILESFAEIGQITINMIEGSREPGSQNRKLGSNGLFPIGAVTGMAGAINNRSGILADLRFDGSHGITFITPSEQRTGRPDTNRINRDGDLTDRDTSVKRDANGNLIREAIFSDIEGHEEKIIGTQPTKAREIRYLFQEHNIVTVEFGYLATESSLRVSKKVSGQIVMTTSEFPDKGMPTFTIVCQSPKAYLDTIGPKDSLSFAPLTGKGNKNTNTVVVPLFSVSKDGTATQAGQPDTRNKKSNIYRHICDKLGMSCSISDFPNDDFVTTKVMSCGTSVKELLDELDSELNSDTHIKITENGECHLTAVHKPTLEKLQRLPSHLNFRWKDPGSIIRKISIKADFGLSSLNTQIGLNSKGKVVSATKDSTDSKEKGGLTGRALPNPLDFNKCTSNAEKLLGAENVSSHVDVNVNVDAAVGVEKTIAVTAADLNRKIIMDMTTLGHPDIVPYVVNIQGLGVRYSGDYRILKVEHILDTSGYTCSLVGETYALDYGGVDPVKEDKVKEGKPPQVDVGLFDAKKVF